MQDQVAERLHGEKDEKLMESRIRKTLYLFAVWTALAIAAICASIIWRDATHMHNPNEMASQVVTIAVTLVWGAVFIFFFSMKLSPLISYRRFLNEIKRGLSREVAGIVVAFDDITTFRDGLSFYAMTVNIGDSNEPEDERRLYWDAQLPRPGIAVGDRVDLTAHGNDIIAMKRQ